MAQITQETRIDLEKSELVAVCGRDRLTLACETGELWLTREGNSTDIILRAGNRITLDAREEAVVSALRPARLLIVPERQHSNPRIRLHGAAQERFARLLRWRFPALASFPSTHLR